MPYEEFAERSSFGNKYPVRICTHHGYPHKHDPGMLHGKWAHYPIGTRDRDDELKTLIGMMCAFSASYGYDETYGIGAGLMIRAGYVPPTSHCEIRFRHDGGKWTHIKPNERTFQGSVEACCHQVTAARL